MRRIYLLCFFCLPFLGYSQEFYPLMKAEKEVKKSLKGKSIQLEKKIIPELALNDGGRDAPILIYKYFLPGTAEKGYAAFTQAKGRFDLFDYLILMSESMEIKSVRILKYRSDYGSEIASKKWLSQFNGFSGGNLKYGKDISAISGATYSAGSITHDIPKVLDILKNIPDE